VAALTRPAQTYGGDWTGGTCSFSDYPNAGINGVALGAQQCVLRIMRICTCSLTEVHRWFGATGCGACVNITGATGSVIAMVNNQVRPASLFPRSASRRD
jgi:hypothetical protein